MSAWPSSSSPLPQQRSQTDTVIAAVAPRETRQRASGTSRAVQSWAKSCSVMERGHISVLLSRTGPSSPWKTEHLNTNGFPFTLICASNSLELRGAISNFDSWMLPLMCFLWWSVYRMIPVSHWRTAPGSSTASHWCGGFGRFTNEFCYIKTPD